MCITAQLQMVLCDVHHCTAPDGAVIYQELMIEKKNILFSTTSETSDEERSIKSMTQFVLCAYPDALQVNYCTYSERILMHCRLITVRIVCVS